MARTVELHEYLPPFLMDFREMRELLAAETPEFQRLCNDCDGLIDEVFILTATETGIARFEKMMKIVPAEGEPLESRRNTVMTRWYDSTPYTVKALRNRIIALQRNSNVQITLYRKNILQQGDIEQESQTYRFYSLDVDLVSNKQYILSACVIAHEKNTKINAFMRGIGENTTVTLPTGLTECDINTECKVSRVFNTTAFEGYDISQYDVLFMATKPVTVKWCKLEEGNISSGGMNEYEIHIQTHLEKMGQVDDLAFIIQSMIPCNMVIESQNTLDCADEVGLGYGVGMGMTNTMFNTNDLNATVDLDVSGKLGIGLSMTETLFLTDDLTKKIDGLSVAGYVGIGNRHTNIINING